MLSETVIAAIMTSSITGAGLVIAFYALIARMSDKIFANRLKQLDERRLAIKEITSKPDSFEDKNLKKTTKRLEDLRKEINSMKTFPKYLGPGVILDFFFFLMTAFLSLIWLATIPENRAPMSDSIVLIIFFMSLFTFFVVGVYGIIDVMTTMAVDFRKLKEKKEDIKVELKEVPKEAKIAGQVAQFLTRMQVNFERNVIIKTDGDLLIADFLIPSKKNPKYVIEVLTRPTSQNVYKISEKYEAFKLQTSAKTILILDFETQPLALKHAKAYWDFVVDVKKLNELSEIIKK
jgi:type III secretory pathway component EscU